MVELDSLHLFYNFQAGASCTVRRLRMRALVELSLQAAVQLFFMFIQSGLTALQPGEAGPLPACPGQPVSFPIQDLHPAGTILYQARPESHTWQQIF